MAGYRPSNLVKKEAREDVDLLKMALAQMWPVSPEHRDELIQRQMEIISNPLVPADVRAGAAKNVLAAGIANLKVVETIIKLGLAQASVKSPACLASTAELAEGLQNFITPPQAEEQPAEVAVPDNWQQLREVS